MDATPFRALSVTVSLPVSRPLVFGAQATSIVQLAPGCKGDATEQDVDRSTKPVAMEKPEKVRVALPIF